MNYPTPNKTTIDVMALVQQDLEKAILAKERIFRYLRDETFIQAEKEPSVYLSETYALTPEDINIACYFNHVAEEPLSFTIELRSFTKDHKGLEEKLNSLILKNN